MIKKIVLASILAMGALNSPVQAASVVVSGLSYHIGVRDYDYNDETKHLNEKNPGIGFELDNGFGMLMMENSYYKTSVVATKGWKWDINDYVAYGARIGITTGYEDTPVGWPILPMGQVELQLKTSPNSRWTTVLGWIPPVMEGYVGVLTLHGKLRF